MELRHRSTLARIGRTRSVVLISALVLLLATLIGDACALAKPASSQFNSLQHSFLGSEPPASQEAILNSVLSTNASLTSCKPTGQISDARCDYETVEMDINSDNFFPILDSVRRETFFRLYKVDLYRECPFWYDDSLCMSPDCTVAEVDEGTIPEEFRAATLSSITTKDEDEIDLKTQSRAPSHHDDHDHDHNHDHDKSSAAADTCQCAETDFCHWEDEDWSPESSWVDLLDNPERFTGYMGTSAHKVWRSIYEENCFGVARPPGVSSASQAKNYKPQFSGETNAAIAAEALSSLMAGRTKALDLSSSEDEQCLEKRVFYKLISGLHASISIHICHDYLDQSTGEWAPNLSCFVERIAQHPERLQNLYFTHAVLVRSLAKLGERLGLESRGKITKSKPVHALKNLAPGLPPPTSPTTVNLASLLQQAVNTPPTFDEASMFDRSNPESEYLRTEFRDRFRNVSRIMDCVGCNKCRLWGKLQTNGLGTALKILFEANHLKAERLLQRSELVSLINTIHRVSESIRAVETFRNLYQEEVARHKSPKSEEKISSRVKRSQVSHSTPSTASSAIDETNNKQYGAPYRIPEASLKDLRSFLNLLWDSAKRHTNKALRLCQQHWEHCLAWSAGMYETFSSVSLQQQYGQSKSKNEL